MEKFHQKALLWSPKNADPVTQRKIQNQSIFIYIFVSFTTFLVFLTIILFMYIDENDVQVCLIDKLLNEQISNYYCSIGLRIFYRLTFIVLGYSFVVFSYQILYLTQEGCFQLYMFNRYLRNLGENYDDISALRLILDQHFQKVVRKRLLFCIKRHNELTE